MKDWNNLSCTSCGLINDYTITEKNNQRVCTCNGCGRFLGNKPKDEYDVKNIMMPFGKYKGQYIIQINDLNYLRWVLKNVTIKGGVLAAVKWKLQ